MALCRAAWPLFHTRTIAALQQKKCATLLVVLLLRNPIVRGSSMAGFTRGTAGNVLARGKVRTVEGAGLGLWLGYLETL